MINHNISINTCFQYSTLHKDILSRVKGVEKTITNKDVYKCVKVLRNDTTLYTYTTLTTAEEIQQATPISEEYYNNTIDKAIQYLQNLKVWK